LAYLNTISFDDTVRIFDIKQDRALMQGLLSFCIAIGAGVGGYLSSYMLSNFARRYFPLMKIMLPPDSLCFDRCHPVIAKQSNRDNFHLSVGTGDIGRHDICSSSDLHQIVRAD
jgi:hypothetical protein